MRIDGRTGPLPSGVEITGGDQPGERRGFQVAESTRSVARVHDAVIPVAAESSIEYTGRPPENLHHK